jgi:ribonuclease P protein component
MLPTKYRLKNRQVFSDVFKGGKSFSNEVVIIKSKSASPHSLKIGFSVGMKFSKKSSVRNKVKRWMREAVRLELKNIKKGCEIVILINPKYPYKQLNSNLVQEKIKDLLKKANVTL